MFKLSCSKKHINVKCCYSAYFFSSHRTVSDVKYWMIRALSLQRLLRAWRNPHLRRCGIPHEIFEHSCLVTRALCQTRTAKLLLKD